MGHKQHLEELKRRIESGEYPHDHPEWGGADVFIKRELDEMTCRWLQDEPVTLHDSGPRRRAVITDYSRELSWLFDELKSLFTDKLAASGRNMFFGRLAERADLNAEDEKKMLNSVIDEAQILLRELDEPPPPPDPLREAVKKITH